MRFDETLAADNIRFLEQGMELIRRLDETRFTSSPAELFRGGVGAQFRHCLDFYGCFLAGLAAGRIDYACRQRDTEVETSRTRALDAAERVCHALRGLATADAGRPVEVRSGDAPERAEPAAFCRSSIGRELGFLLSHTVHHYALIAAILRLEGQDVHRDFPEFGVAPSTLIHWREAGSPSA